MKSWCVRSSGQTSKEVSPWQDPPGQADVALDRALISQAKRRQRRHAGRKPLSHRRVLTGSTPPQGAVQVVRGGEDRLVLRRGRLDLRACDAREKKIERRGPQEKPVQTHLLSPPATGRVHKRQYRAQRGFWASCREYASRGPAGLQATKTGASRPLPKLELPRDPSNNVEVPLRICSSNSTPLGIMASLLVAALLVVVAFRVVLSLSFTFAVAFWAATAVFVVAMMVGPLLINLRQYTFSAALRTLTVRERWLYFLRRRPRSIPLSEIAAVYMRSNESLYPVVVLRSGKKLYPRLPGSPREINRYCAAVKRITHVGSMLPSERWARGSAGPTDRLASALFIAACVLVAAEMLFSERLPHAINVALIVASILVFVVVIGLAIWTPCWRGCGIRSVVRESFRLSLAGICPNCGFESKTEFKYCPACGTRCNSHKSDSRR